MFDIWNQHNELAEKIYNETNYCIVEHFDQQNKMCFVFFSSNNIWFPNTEEAFMRSFVENDYYEWKKYSDLPVEKIIYVRDIYKSWYVTGINQRLDSVDKVIEFLEKETEGMDIVTVGSSAGGYMAALTASLLRARYCICFSPQFDLTVSGALGVNPFLKKYIQDTKRQQYYKITDIIRNSETEIFYFMPAYAKSDLEQLRKVKDVQNIKILRIASRHHGVPILKGNISTLLSLNQDELNELFDSKSEKIVGKCELSVELCGVSKTLLHMKNEIISQVRNKLRG